MLFTRAGSSAFARRYQNEELIWSGRPFQMALPSKSGTSERWPLGFPKMENITAYSVKGDEAQFCELPGTKK